MVENHIKEKCQYIFEDMYNNSLSSLTLVISDQELIKDDQVLGGGRLLLCDILRNQSK